MRDLERVFREESGVVLAALIARFGDFDLAEDAFQEAVEIALERWPRDGVPERPGAWLTTTARRRAVDRLRHENMRRSKEDALRDDERERREKGEAEEAMPVDVPDERLRLVFTCCHPALAQEARIALTLRSLCGLSTADVARAFLVPEATMAKRLVRAKKKIRDARIPYRVPDARDLPERLVSVLAVVYLVFNQGWSETEGGDAEALCEDAIRLARVLARLLPDEPEVLGLLALVLFSDARRPARVVDGTWVPLEVQDRSLWRWSAIREALGILSRALDMRRPGPYQLQASISALHAESRGVDDVRWTEIAVLYARLAELQPTPVVALNRVVAVGRSEGPKAGLALLEKIRPAETLLESYAPWHAARADLLERAGHREEAATALRRALELTRATPERRHLAHRLDVLLA